nr:hypothetical protein [uncultured Cohaesibacter sp.]
MTTQKELIIAGLARDCAHSLPDLLEKLSQLADLFEQSKFIFLENDSRDDTKAVLNSFKTSRPDVHVEFFDKIDRLHPKRTDRLAFLRNTILKKAFSLSSTPTESYLLLLDMDGAITNIDIDRIANHIRNDDGSWTGLFANQLDHYYDLWALRHPTYCPYDIWEKVRNRPAGMDKKQAIETYITPLHFSIAPDRGLIEVESAFGGMGIYRLSMLTECRYIGLDDDGNEICEHVAFNRDIISKGGKLFIDAGLITGTGRENHAPAKKKSRKWLDKMRAKLSRIF